jgi:transposase, IS30 family
MARRGRKRQLELETEYWRLLASGVGTVEACKALGIGRKTGYRWRAETGGLPPVRRGEAGRSGRYLSLLERQRIATLRRLGLGVRRIAAELGRNPSTISRELLRHRRGHDRNYDGDLAHARAPVRPPGVRAEPAQPRRAAAPGRAGQARAGMEPRADRRAPA